MRRKSEISMQALRCNMELAPIEGMQLNEDLAFSVEIPLEMLFDQFTVFISKKDFKGIA